LDMSNSLSHFLHQKLARQDESGLRRTLRIGNERLTDFASNDYLGLARSKELHEAIAQESANFANGSTGSRLLTGNSKYIEETEKYLSDLFKADAGLLCNSGYAANLAVLSSVPQKGDTILYDELAHASLKDGMRLSLAQRFSFRHNDLNDIEQKIKKSTGQIFIVIESVYSMDGDRSPLKDIVSIADRYGAVLILDEAHSTGLYSENGAGISVMEDLHKKIPIRIYTFGKAMGVHGAFIAGEQRLKDYIVNFARPFIYTTALSPHSVASINCAFRHLRRNPQLAIELEKNIRTYQSVKEKIPGATASESAIQTIIIPGNAKVRSASLALNDHGFDMRPILSPTVAKGKERLRICLHSFNTEEEISRLGDALQTLAFSETVS
jgi:8-amino-7-oxononanoate synthase